MRKNIFIALAALMTLAVSCKKNNIEKTDNAGADPNPAVVLEQSPDITRIIKFNNDVVMRRENPGLKTCEVITLDEAKDNIADLFNAVYGEPTEYYGETEHAEFSVTLPVDADGTCSSTTRLRLTRRPWSWRVRATTQVLSTTKATSACRRPLKSSAAARPR